MNPNFEILAPAGNLDIFKAVIDAGADAVYIGGSKFGARAYANNFTEDEVLEALHYAHLRGKQVYMTVNTLFKNHEIKELYDYLLPYYENGLDAVIVQDLGAIKMIHELFPALPIHTSTQLTITGIDGANLMKAYGVTRIVMAREVSLAEMKKIHEETGLELEAFIHGALCYSYSGQCLFSSLLGGRSGNRGRCAQPCRLPYAVKDATGKCVKDESYILSLKDFCGLKSLKEFQDAGVFSLKIEGRMKQAGYAASVVAMYRKYADLLFENPEAFSISETDYDRMISYGNRCGFTDTFLHTHNGSDMVTYEKPSFFSEIDSYHGGKTYIPVSGVFVAGCEIPTSLTITHKDLEEPIYVEGPVASPALKQPITEQDLKERLQKTHDTAFVFDDLQIFIEDNLFLPNGVINQIRRDAILALENALLLKYQRSVSEASLIPVSYNEQENPMNGNSITVETKEQLAVALSMEWCNAIGLSTDAYNGYDACKNEIKEDSDKIKATGKKAILIFPSIFREETRQAFLRILPAIQDAKFHGVLVKNLESLAFCKEYLSDLAIVIDHNLYTYNNLAKEAMIAFGIVGDTIPLELNQKEIAGRDNTNSVMMLYGYYPLMTTANCVCKNSKGCKKCPETLYLIDRYHKAFPVRNCCNSCYNVIYNSLPTMLLNKLEAIKKANVRNYRFHFTVESKEKTEEILSYVTAVLEGKRIDVSSNEQNSFTNGHFTRGVE